MTKERNAYGEGNYEASRQYNDATKRFVASGKVEKAALDAAPTSDAEALQLAAAEAEGRARAKEEDPMLTRNAPPTPAPAETRRDPRRARGGDDGTQGSAPEETRTPKPGEDA